MNKRTLAIIVEVIPLISAPLFFLLFRSAYDSALVRGAILVTMTLAFLGFVFFFVGRKIAGKDMVVLILGILDWMATSSIVGFYIMVIILFGL